MTLEQPAVILASASPRRRDLLGYLGVSFDAIATAAEEEDTPPPPDIVAALPAAPLPDEQHPALLAWRKATAACAHTAASVMIGADTIVVLDGAVLGKPSGPDQARAMLRRLSGRTHVVYTGLVVIEQPPEGASRLHFDLVASRVVIAELSEHVIAEYVATGEPLDKAGAYGIQGLGGRLVRMVQGSYTNVVGLPLPALHRLLTSAGVRDLVDPSVAYKRWLAAQGKEPLPCPPTLP